MYEQGVNILAWRGIVRPVGSPSRAGRWLGQGGMTGSWYLHSLSPFPTLNGRGQGRGRRCDSPEENFLSPLWPSAAHLRQTTYSRTHRPTDFCPRDPLAFSADDPPPRLINESTVNYQGFRLWWSTSRAVSRLGTHEASFSYMKKRPKRASHK